MKSNEEMIDSLFDRREKYEKERGARRRSAVRIASIPVCAVLIALGAVIAWQATRTTESALSPDGETGVDAALEATDSLTPSAAGSKGNTLTYAPIVPETDNGRDTSESEQSAVFEGGDGRIEIDETTVVEDGQSAYFFIPALPATNEIDFVGEELTVGEARAYFAENIVSITSSLAASGVPTDDFHISESGYLHIKYTGAEGEKLTADQSWRDFPAYSGDTLVAIITLTKEDGKLYSSLAFGSPLYGKYDKFLKAHTGEKLIWVYAGPGEIALAPDGDALIPNGSQLSWFFGGLDDPYSWFFNEDATFIP